MRPSGGYGNRLQPPTESLRTFPGTSTPLAGIMVIPDSYDRVALGTLPDKPFKFALEGKCFPAFRTRERDRTPGLPRCAGPGRQDGRKTQDQQGNAKFGHREKCGHRARLWFKGDFDCSCDEGGDPGYENKRPSAIAFRTGDPPDRNQKSQSNQYHVDLHQVSLRSANTDATTDPIVRCQRLTGTPSFSAGTTCWPARRDRPASRDPRRWHRSRLAFR